MSIVSTRKLGQPSYNAYNSFIFDDNGPIFQKMVTRINLFEKVKDLHGDIVECGVYKGSGLMLWAKLLEMKSPHDIRKVIGLDFFGDDPLQNLTGVDKDGMTQVFSRSSQEGLSMNEIAEKLEKGGIPKHRFELVKGDVSETIPEYLSMRPGLRISLLYLDLDVEKPTFDSLSFLFDRVVPGGYIVFDEYAYHLWSEANAVDKFFADKKLKIHKLNVPAPTAYVRKPTCYGLKTKTKEK